jgi:hypothetical protein
MNSLDTKIHKLLDDVDRSSPPPPPFERLRSGDTGEPGRANRRRIIAGAAAAAVVAIGVGGLASLDRNEPATSVPADQATVDGPAAETPDAGTTVAENDPATTAFDPATQFDDAPANGESLFTTPLAADQVPVVILEGANTTSAHSLRYPGPFGGGTAGSTVLVPDGAPFDMPRIVMDVVERNAANGNGALDLGASGDPIDVAGTTGYLSTEATDPETGEEGPIHLLFFDVDPGRYVRVNAVGVAVEEMVSIVDTYDPDTGAVPVPDGFMELAMPDHDINHDVEFQYDLDGGVRVTLNGSSRSAEHLLGWVLNSVTSTQVIDGIDVIVRPTQEEAGGVNVFWTQDDWGFRANVSGTEDPAAIADVLRGFRLVDDATFTDTYSAGDVVTDTTRAAEVQAMLADVELPQALETLEADLINRRGANSRYQEIAEVSGTIACALLDLHFNSGPAGPWEPAAALAASTEWDMLLEIEDQGGWSSAVWQAAAAIGGDGLTPPTTTIGGGQAPTLESLGPGLGCDTR